VVLGHTANGYFCASEASPNGRPKTWKRIVVGLQDSPVGEMLRIGVSVRPSVCVYEMGMPGWAHPQIDYWCPPRGPMLVLRSSTFPRC
jgi:hypothetical protein